MLNRRKGVFWSMLTLLIFILFLITNNPFVFTIALSTFIIAHIYLSK